MAGRILYDSCKDIGVKLLESLEGQVPDFRVAAMAQEEKGRDQIPRGKREIPPSGRQLSLAGGSFADDPGNLRRNPEAHGPDGIVHDNFAEEKFKGF
jgi:hypothetical protein